MMKRGFALSVKRKPDRAKEFDKSMKKIISSSVGIVNKSEKKKKNKIAKIFEISEELDDLDEDDDDDVTDVIIKKTTSQDPVAREKLDKESDDFFEKRFSNELVLLYNLLKEGMNFKDDSKFFLDGLKKSSMRNGKLISDMYANVNANQKHILDIIKEINNLKTKVSDLEVKKLRAYGGGINGKDTGNGDKETKDEFLLNKMFNDIQNMVNSTSQKGSYLSVGEEMTDEGFDVDRVLEMRASDLDRDDEYAFTDNEKNFKYEGQNVKVYVRKFDDTGEWDLVAMDDFDEILDDYQLPPKENLGKVKFFEDEDYAEDRNGIRYPLICVASATTSGGGDLGRYF